MSVAPEFPSTPDPSAPGEIPRVTTADPAVFEFPSTAQPDDDDWAGQICRHAIDLVETSGQRECTMLFFIGGARPGSGEESRDVGIKDLEGAHPLEGLIGLEAPAEWTVLGVAATGRARHLDGDESMGRVMTAVAVTRAGTFHGHTVFDTGAVLDDPPTVGEIPDALRRAMGLPTPPPETGPALLFAVDWLAAVAAAARDGAEMDLTAAMALHPACGIYEPETRVTRGQFLRAAGALGNVASWDLLRMLTADGRRSEVDLLPEEAAWMDEGMFSRWVLGRRPTLSVLLDELELRAAGGLAAELRSLLGDLDVLS